MTIDSGCTKGDHKSYECPACGWVFPGVMCRGVGKQAIKECSLRKRFKAAFKRLEAAGVVDKGKYELMSVGSCREGGCSGACAYGVRNAQCSLFNYRPRLRGRQLNSNGVFDKYALGRTAPAGLSYAYPVSRLRGRSSRPPTTTPSKRGGAEPANRTPVHSNALSLSP